MQQHPAFACHARMKCVLYAATILLLTSCLNTRYINSSVPANAPYFNRKGQVESSFYYSSGKLNPVSENKSNGFDLLAAYAVSNYIAVTLDYIPGPGDKIFPGAVLFSPYTCS